MWLLVEWSNDREVFPTYSIIHKKYVLDKETLEYGKYIRVRDKRKKKKRRARILMLSESKRQLKEQKRKLIKRARKVRSILSNCMRTCRRKMRKKVEPEPEFEDCLPGPSKICMLRIPRIPNMPTSPSSSSSKTPTPPPIIISDSSTSSSSYKSKRKRRKRHRMPTPPAHSSRSRSPHASRNSISHRDKRFVRQLIPNSRSRSMICGTPKPSGRAPKIVYDNATQTDPEPSNTFHQPTVAIFSLFIQELYTHFLQLVEKIDELKAKCSENENDPVRQNELDTSDSSDSNVIVVSDSEDNPQRQLINILKDLNVDVQVLGVNGQVSDRNVQESDKNAQNSNVNAQDSDEDTSESDKSGEDSDEYSEESDKNDLGTDENALEPVENDQNPDNNDGIADENDHVAEHNDPAEVVEDLFAVGNDDFPNDNDYIAVANENFAVNDDYAAVDNDYVVAHNNQHVAVNNDYVAVNNDYVVAHNDQHVAVDNNYVVANNDHQVAVNNEYLADAEMQEFEGNHYPDENMQVLNENVPVMAENVGGNAQIMDGNVPVVPVMAEPMQPQVLLEPRLPQVFAPPRQPAVLPEPSQSSPRPRKVEVRRVSAQSTVHGEPSNPAQRCIYNSDEDMVAIGYNRTLVPRRIMNDINWTIYTTATRQLLQAVFPRRVLATHSLSGKPSPAFAHHPRKERLDPRIVDDIVQTVRDRCGAHKQWVRTVITTKCTDEARLYRNRQNQQNRNDENQENQDPEADPAADPGLPDDSSSSSDSD